jgi:hypothetical protein
MLFIMLLNTRDKVSLLSRKIIADIHMKAIKYEFREKSLKKGEIYNFML